MWTAEEIRNYKIRDDHDRIIFKAYGLLRDRANFYLDPAHFTYTAWTRGKAYESACTILEYAMTENWSGLNNFDYYENEKEG